MSYPSEIIGKFWVDRLPKLNFGQAIKFKISKWIEKLLDLNFEKLDLPTVATDTKAGTNLV